MERSKILFCTDPNNPNDNLMISTLNGWQCLGQVWKYESPEQLQEAMKAHRHWVQVDGYNIALVYAGNIKGWPEPWTDWGKEPIIQMAKLYKEFRIDANPARYKRYKIDG